MISKGLKEQVLQAILDASTCWTPVSNLEPWLGATPRPRGPFLDDFVVDYSKATEIAQILIDAFETELALAVSTAVSEHPLQIMYATGTDEIEVRYDSR